MTSQANKIVIRRARPADGPDFEKLYRQLHQGEYISPGAANMKSAIERVSRNRHEKLLVATTGRHIVGTAHALVFRHLGRALRPVAIVENVVVDRNHRRAGVGKRLMAAAVAFARRNNCYKVALTTNRKRRDAHQFYERLGWRSTHLGYTFPLDK
jgi:GNAT superfamily N-acetyltransferase